jgi:hypothetical protein
MSDVSRVAEKNSTLKKLYSDFQKQTQKGARAVWSRGTDRENAGFH